MANQATVTWKEGLHFEGVASGHAVQMDGLPEAGGQDLGFRPMELLLVSLAGCTAMDVISVLTKMHQDVTNFEVEVKGERATEHPRVYTSIQIGYRVRGRKLAHDMVARAVQLSQEKYCSAEAMLAKAAPITSRIEMENERG